MKDGKGLKASVEKAPITAAVEHTFATSAGRTPKDKSWQPPGSERLYAMLTATVILLLWQTAYHVDRMFFDAEGYWLFAKTDAVLHLTPNLRGYFFSFLLSPIRFVSDMWPNLGLLPYRLASSLIYAYGLSCLVPDVFRRLCGGKTSIVRRLAIPVLVMTFAPGLVIYTLSDLPALLLMMGGMQLAMVSKEYQRGRAMVLLVIAGMCMAGAYNTRPIYLMPMVLLLLSVPTVLYSGARPRRQAVIALTLLAGITIATAPQMVSNKRNFGTYYPGVIAELKGLSVASRQLVWGVGIQKYETSINEKDPSPKISYADPAGLALLAEEGIGETVSVPQYVQLVIRHLPTFAGIYGRHIINGLDFRDGEMYLRQASPHKETISALNFIILFAAVFAILTSYEPSPGTSLSRRFRWISCAVIFGPVLMIIPSAMETRFFCRFT